MTNEATILLMKYVHYHVSRRLRGKPLGDAVKFLKKNKFNCFPGSVHAKAKKVMDAVNAGTYNGPVFTEKEKVRLFTH